MTGRHGQSSIVQPRPLQGEFLRVPKLIMFAAGEEVRPFPFSALAVFQEKFPDVRPQPLWMLRQGPLILLAATGQPCRPHAIREVLAGHPQLVDGGMFKGNGIVIERLPKPVTDHGVHRVQDPVSHQPALEPEIEIFRPPQAHLRIKSTKLLIQ